MQIILRILLLAGGAIAGLFIAQDAPNFGVAQVMATIALIAIVVIGVAMFTRR